MWSLQLLVLMTLVEHHVLGSVAFNATTQPKYNVCVKLDLNSVTWSANSSQFSEEVSQQDCLNATEIFNETVGDQGLSLSPKLNSDGQCTVIRSRHSPFCHVVEKVDVFYNGNQSWIIISNSTLATCRTDNDSISVCLPNDDKLCVCRKWYHIESDCAYRDNNSDTTYHLFSESFTDITELPASTNVNPVCKPPSQLLERIRAIFMLVLVSVSVLSLVLSVAIHLTLFRNSHDVLPLLCHKLTLLVCYFIFLVRSFRPYSKDINCINGALYFTSQCAFLSSFFWLNVLAFEMWRQFHPNRMLQRSQRHFRWKKLICQSLYGWIVPIVLTIIYCLLRKLSDGQLFMYQGVCPVYFQRNAVQVIYIAVVNELALLISVILFVLIVVNMKKIKASVAAANNNQQMFWTYVKLMTLASFSVIFYVLKDAIPPRGMDQMYWVPADIFICLHGFLLFLMDCCNSNARRSFKKGIESLSSSLRTTSSSVRST